MSLLNSKNHRDKKLGFGLMRLPLTNEKDAGKIDYQTLCKMVDNYINAGFFYFDTAVPYHGGKNSEIAFKECVAKRYPRDSFTITDKLSLFIVNEADKLEDFFTQQLECCGVEFFDIYLLHAMNKDLLDLAEKIGAFDFVEQKLKDGKVKHIGFSFHDSPQVLEEILTKHPQMEYVQLQINYADWENPDVQSRACYEIARKHNKKILVMEPVKGGLLVNIPDEACQIFTKSQPDMTAASWAVRFAASLEGVEMVLSGMSNIQQMEDNLSYMKNFHSLTQEEMNLVFEAAKIIKSKESIACTNCRYCVDGCPQKIPIPEYFKIINDVSKFGESYLQGAKERYGYIIENPENGKASQCISCGQCEEHCPQHLPIRKYLENVTSTLE